MLKKSLLLLLISSSSFLIAQNSTEKELKLIETTEQAESFLETKKSRKNKVITFNEEKHKTVLAKKLFKLNVGGTKVYDSEFQKTFYKVIKKSKKTYYRVAYIFLDGSKYKIKDLKKLREDIIARYENGAPFDFLAKQHSMDGTANKGGDLGWFLEDEMHPDFEEEAINKPHSVNDIFTVDIPSENWYYIILKTHEPKEILEIEVLKVVEPLR